MKKGGGQPGNTNALKHGLYAKRFTKAERAGLRHMVPGDLEAEIYMLRAVTDRILAQIETATEDAEAYAKLINSLTAAVTTLNTTMRTHAILAGTYTPLDDALTQALADLDDYADANE